ncbi:MAG: Mce-associated rane protein [Actinomycetota bacterium]|nr:Mce-associated rane protein [Actinomycetota bacterium]
MLIALVASAAAGYLLLTRDRTESARQDALAAARQYAVDLTTYDFATVDADFQRFARHGTKAFRASYAATIAASEPAIVKAQTRSLGTVVGAGLESYSHDRASVLVAVDQELHSATKPGATVDRSRIRMTLVRSGDGWLVSAVKVF